MSKDLNQLFDDLLSRYVDSIEKDYIKRYKTAKDKEFIIEELTKGTDFTIEWEELDSQKGKLITLFTEMYKRGDDMNIILKHLRKAYGEVEDEKPIKRIEQGKRITLYLSEEEKALKKLALDEPQLLKLLIKNTAYRIIKKKLPSLFDEANDKKASKNKAEVTWTGSDKNKNEFVQFIYGLHQAGLINEGKGEITKLTESLAEKFDIELGKNWQSNHSASIHKAKADYQPPIFDKIKEAYLNYAKSLAYGKKQKK